MDGPPLILVVDDDVQIREVLRQIFTSARYECLLAANGQEGLEMFRAHHPALIVTELKTPVMDGIGLLEGVRETDDDTAVIVLTGVPDVRSAIASLKLGASDFILKPVNVDELLFAASRALERRQLLIERREYHALLEQRVEEATRELQTAYRATLEALGSALNSDDTGAETRPRRVHGGRPRSTPAQIEYWNRLGQAVDVMAAYGDILALKRGREPLSLPRHVDRAALHSALYAAVEDPDRTGVKVTIASGRSPVYAIDPDHPGRIVAVNADGSRVPGHLEGRRFVPDGSPPGGEETPQQRRQARALVYPRTRSSKERGKGTSPSGE